MRKIIGRGISNEVRKSISENRRNKCVGENNPQYKKVVSAETRMRLSISHKGKKDSPETRLKKSLSHIGHPVSEKQIEFIRNLNKGKVGGTFRAFAGDNPASKSIILLLDDVPAHKFDTIRLAADFFNMGKSPYKITKICLGDKKLDIIFNEKKVSLAFGDTNTLMNNDDLCSLKKIIDITSLPQKIEMLDMNNNFIRVFENKEEVKTFLNIKSASHILGCCRNERKSAYGYKWRYKLNGE